MSESTRLTGTENSNSIFQPPTPADQIDERDYSEILEERARFKRRLNTFFSVVIGVAILIIWQFAATTGLVHRLILPPPTDIAVAVSRVIFAEFFMPNVGVTLTELAFGFAIGVFLGLSLGILVASFEIFRMTIYPYVIALQAPPKVVLAPIFVTWFGFGLESKVAMAVVISFFPLFINTIVGLSSVERDAIKLMQSLTASRFQIFYKLLLPNALPMIFAGLKMCWTLAVIGVVVAEFVGAEAGIGYLIEAFNFQLEIPRVFALIFLLSAFTVAVYQLLEFIEKRLIFWHETNVVTEA